MSWQPIETAPRDGTPFWARGIIGDTAVVCWWKTDKFRDEFDDEDEKYPWAFLEEDGLLNGTQDGAHGPTEWMPLEPPEQSRNADD